MSRPVILSLLWPKNAHVLLYLLQKYGYDLAAPLNSLPPEVGQAATAAGGRLIPFAADLNEKNFVEAHTRLGALRDALPSAISRRPQLKQFNPSAIQSTIEKMLTERLQTSIAAVDAAESLRERENVRAVLLNETDLTISKTLALWAKTHNIPVLMLSHGTDIGHTYTVTKQMPADVLLFCGERGTELYLDVGIPRERMDVVGNPAWDGYPQILNGRDAFRAEVFKQLQLVDGAPLAVFATTWNAKLSALQDGKLFEKTVRAFIRGCKLYQAENGHLNVIVKDRPSNATFGRAAVKQIAEEEGFAQALYADGDMPVFICAADVVVGYDSNAQIEASIAGVPSIGLWGPSSWLQGPSFDRQDGMPLVQMDNPQGLADVMKLLLKDGAVRNATIKKQSDRLAYFAVAVDGLSGERAAESIARRLDAMPATVAPTPPERPAWHELSNPRTVAEKGGTQEYYDHPRHELINLLNHTPRMVLDIGCAGGATALELKKLHPKAIVHGIELSEEAAALAATRVDKILRENVEQMDFSAFGYTPGSIDVVFLPDVLEHLYNPWQLLVKLKPYLSKDAQILASIPNARNAWLVTQLMAGKWDYVEEGLLDVTHIRFFTLKSVIELFGQTGYSIERIGQNIDGRMPAVDVPEGGTISFDMGTATFKNMTAQDVWEMRTFQFLIDAKPS